LLPARALPSPRTHWRNSRRVRRRASGRSVYNYMRDYDPQVGRYVESDPIGLNGGSYSTYAYGLGNPTIDIDPFGLASCGFFDCPALPQSLVNYFEGYGSYYEGLGSAAKHIYWRSGLAGKCEQQNEIQDEAVLGLALNSLRIPAVRNAALSAGESWALNNKAYLAGRMSAGLVTSTVTGVGLAGGLSLATVAGLGTALDNIDRGATEASDVMTSVLGDRMPQLLQRSRCGCQQ
jgi:RHS repeat-associated protein